MPEISNDPTPLSMFEAVLGSTARIPHSHSTYIDGCFRCELSRQEIGGDQT